MLVAAALLGAGVLASSSGVDGPWGVLTLAAGLGVLGLVAFGAGDSLLRRFADREAGKTTPDESFERPAISRGRWISLLGPPFGFHLAFLAATSGLVWLLTWAIRPEAIASFSPMQVVGLYALAWAAGTVTLGAPAGLGVREAILTLQLSPMLGPAPAAAVALALRFATLFGDLLTALAGYALKARPEPNLEPDSEPSLP